MFPLSRGKIIGLIAPVLLFVVIYFLGVVRPRSLGVLRDPAPLPGTTGPAGISAPAISLAYSPDGTLYCGSLDGNVQVYLAERKRFRSLRLIPPQPGSRSSSFLSKGGYPSRLFFAPGGKKVYVPQSNSFVPTVTQIVEPGTRQATATLPGPNSPAVDFSGDGKWAAMGTNNGIWLLDLAKTKPVPQPSPRKGFPGDPKGFGTKIPAGALFVTGQKVMSADFSPDSKTLAVGYSGQISLFDVASPLKAPRTQCSLGTITPSSSGFSMPSNLQGTANPFWIEWSPDGKKIAALSTNQIAIFDSALKPLVSAPLPTPSPGLNTNYSMSLGRGYSIMDQTDSAGANIVWNRAGTTILTGGDEVRSWDVASLKLLTALGVSGPVALSPDEKTVVTSNNPQPGEYPSLLQWQVG